VNGDNSKGSTAIYARTNTAILVVTLLLTGALKQAYAEVCLPQTEGRPKIALVLGGGGARGAAHVGVIKALEEMRVPVDYIVGTSMGALVGGLYASGMSSDELTALMSDIDWANMFSDKARRQDRPYRRKRDDDLGLYAAKIGLSEGTSRLPPGAVAGQNIEFLLNSLVGVRNQSDDFDDLPIPFRAVAADILSAEVAILDSGNLATAMRASMALPGVFDPVEIGDKYLVDGGVLMNVPVSVGKELGADIIIAVDVGSPLAGKENVKNLFQIIYQLTGVVTIVNTRQQTALLGEDDLLLVPQIEEDITTGSFARAPEAIPVGYQEAIKNRATLSRLAISEGEWERRNTAIGLCVDGMPTIDFFTVKNYSRFSDEVIRRRLAIETGKPLDLHSLEEDIKAIYSLGFLQRVTFEVVQDGEQTGLEIEVVDDARGTDYFEYGLGINSSNFDSSFNIRLGYLKTDVDQYGSEFRGLIQVGEDLGGMVELYKMLGPDMKYVFLPRFAGERSNLNVFDDNGNKLSQLKVTESILSLGFGREFGRDALLLAGVNVGSGEVDITIGDPGFDEFEFDRGEFFVTAHFDNQDSRYFPGMGTNARLTILSSTTSLGADQEFEQLSSVFMHAWTIKRHSLFAGIEANVSSDDAIPVQSLYRAGGFPRMSGYEYNELLGENFGMIFGGYRYKLLEGSILPGYLGGTIEYGNVYQDYSDLFSDGILNGSVYFGIDSIIGPMYLGVGFAEGGRRVPFLSIGSIFTRDSLTR
jgi:NTE family protein